MSDTLPIDEYLTDIEPELSQCPVPVMEKRLRETAIDICEQVNLWTWRHPEIPVIKGETCYELGSPSTDSEIHSIIELSKEGTRLDDMSLLDSLRTRTVNGFIVPRRGEIELLREPVRDAGPVDPALPIPAGRSKGLEALVTLKPTREALRLPERLYRDYHDLVVEGSLYRLRRMRGYPWSDPDYAMGHRGNYELLIAAAKRATDRGYTTKSPRVRPRKFA